MTSCVSTQILWDAENANMFGELCRRILRFCEEGQPCQLALGEAGILLVSSQRTAPPSTASVARALPEDGTVWPPDRSAEAGL